ncbi:MAG TPA: hypothetical protein V6C97_28510 [Oculatellaceae cyanobacterium]
MSSTNTLPEFNRLSARLDERCQLWQSQLRSTSSTNRKSVEDSVTQIYSLVGKKTPAFVWCESPWQLVTMAAILEKQANKDAINKWHSHPRQLRLSENDFASLWAKLWQQIEAQLDSERRKTAVFADFDTQKETNDKWKDSWIGKVPFVKNPFQQSIWMTNTKIQNAWQTLQKEMRAPCEVRYGTDPNFGKLQAQFRTRMGARTEPVIARQLLADMAAFNSAGFNLGFFEQFTTENFARVGWEVLKGNALEEFDTFRSSEERKAFEFALSLFVTSFFACSQNQFTNALAMVPFYDFLCDELPELPIGPSNRKRAKSFLNLVKETPCALFFDKVALISEHPLVLETDENGRLHSASGPALAFGDGYRLYSWHGTTVGRLIIEQPEGIKVEHIIKEWNAEIRRVMIDRYGSSRFIIDCGATEVHRDECGVLYRKEFTNDEALVMVKVINSTPEPDGSFKEYFLRVPPIMTTAREAVAWTFDMDPHEYSPQQQT